jgi:hypothetical protein
MLKEEIIWQYRKPESREGPVLFFYNELFSKKLAVPWELP